MPEPQETIPAGGLPTESGVVTESPSAPRVPVSRPVVGALMWSSMLFVGAFYATGMAAVLNGRSVFPERYGQWGATATFFLVAFGLYLIIAAALYHTAVSVGGVGSSFLSTSHRTGVVGVELVISALGVLALFVVLVSELFYAPLVLAALIPVLFSLPQAVYRRPVGTGRTVFVPPQSHAVTEPPMPEPAPNEDLPSGWVYRHYEWTYGIGLADATRYAVDIPINERLYDEMRLRNPGYDRSSKNPYFKLVVGGITGEVICVARELLAISSRGLGRYDEICLAASFVQQVIEYATDDATKGREYFRYPIETLYEGVGDCDCKAVLLAAVLTALGHDVVVLETATHVALGIGGAAGLPGSFVRVGGKPYFFLETTAAAWLPGSLPPDMKNEDFRAYPLGLIE